MISLNFVLIIILGGAFISYSDNVNCQLADSLIRFHVLANSDSLEDQTLKREIRDKIIDFMKEELQESKDIEVTKYKINKNIEKIENIAKYKVMEHGKNYAVKAVLGKYLFPTKMYGDIVLPAGTYQALRIVIGEGEGSNWWCVLFPPLCFVDASHGIIPDYIKEDLRNVLSAENYNVITSRSYKSRIPIKMKFKSAEVIASSKIKISRLLKKNIR